MCELKVFISKINKKLPLGYFDKEKIRIWVDDKCYDNIEYGTSVNKLVLTNKLLFITGEVSIDEIYCKRVNRLDIKKIELSSKNEIIYIWNCNN
jgi:IMP cyclohydrolase